MKSVFVRRFVPVVPLALLLTFAGLLSIGIKSAMAACTINWDVNQPTCVTANTDRSFSFNLGTTWTSINQTTWTLYTAYTPGNSPNIVNGSVTPGSHTVTITDPTVTQVGVKNTTSAGSLATGKNCGIHETSAWDGTHWNCSGAWDVKVRMTGTACSCTP